MAAMGYNFKYLVNFKDSAPRIAEAADFLRAASAAAAIALSDGGKGDSFVLSLLYFLSFGCSPGVYGVSFSYLVLKNLLIVFKSYRCASCVCGQALFFRKEGYILRHFRKSFFGIIG